MKLEETLRLRIPAETKELLERQADGMDRSVGWLVRKILESYVAQQKELLANVERMKERAEEAAKLADWGPRA